MSRGGWPGTVASMDDYITDNSTLFDFSDFFRGKANLPGVVGRLGRTREEA